MEKNNNIIDKLKLGIKALLLLFFQTRVEIKLPDKIIESKNKENSIPINKSWYIGWILGIIFALLFWLHYHLQLSISSYGDLLPEGLRTGVVAYILLLIVFFIMIINFPLTFLTAALHDDLNKPHIIYYFTFCVYWLFVTFMIGAIWKRKVGGKILILLGIIFIILYIIGFNLLLMMYAT